jgi:hypothetical protein
VDVSAGVAVAAKVASRRNVMPATAVCDSSAKHFRRTYAVGVRVGVGVELEIVVSVGAATYFTFSNPSAQSSFFGSYDGVECQFLVVVTAMTLELSLILELS